jgi:Leucine-rich repeat (LRR) protein
LTGVSLMFNLWPIVVEINNCPNLQRIDFFTCFLNNLGFLNNINPENLTELSLTNNDFPSQDLSVFSRFVNLKILNVNNIPAQKWKKGLPYNRFYGSFAPLKNLIKLERLGIINTDIDSGLEYLSDSVKDIYCTSEEWKGAKVKKIEKELKKFGKPREDGHDYDYNFGHLLPLWKKANPEKVRIAQQSSSNRIDGAEEMEQSLVV